MLVDKLYSFSDLPKNLKTIKNMTTANSKLWYLEQINLFKVLSDEEKVKMSAMLTEKTKTKKEYIFFPDEPSKQVFILKSGRVKIGTFNEGKEIIKTILYPGSIFGELGLVGQDIRKDFAIALDDEVVICSIHTDDFLGMMRLNARLNFEVTRHIGDRLLKMERKLESLVFKDAQSRILDFIREMGNEYGKPIGFETLVEHDLTHQEIAQLTATSRQTVTTVLNELKNENKIHLRRNKILIRDLENF